MLFTCKRGPRMFTKSVLSFRLSSIATSIPVPETRISSFRACESLGDFKKCHKLSGARGGNIGKVLPILMPELDGSSFLAPQLPARLRANSGRSFSNSATEARPSHPQPKWGKCSACTWMQPRSASQTRDTCSPDRFMSSTRRDRLPEAWARPRQRAFTTHSSLKSVVNDAVKRERLGRVCYSRLTLSASSSGE